MGRCWRSVLLSVVFEELRPVACLQSDAVLLSPVDAEHMKKSVSGKCWILCDVKETPLQASEL